MMMMVILVNVIAVFPGTTSTRFPMQPLLYRQKLAGWSRYDG
jgi:hypothetical protein